MFKRVTLFILTNLAIMLMLGIVMQFVMAYFHLQPGSLDGLFVMCAIFGMGGSFISLAMSKWMAKRSTGAQVIENPTTATERWLIDTVTRQAQQAGIGMPEVAIYDSPDINAFATGMSRNSALVAVSTGLLNSLGRDEAEAVLGHEITHVANGDMVTLTLIQGVLNTFVMFFARIVAGIISGALQGNSRENSGGFVYFMIVMALQMVFGLVASMIVMAFSRWREYRADAGGATLAGRQKMIAALEALKRGHESTLQGQLTAFGINSGVKKSELFMSHPPLEKRIEALRNLQVGMM